MEIRSIRTPGLGDATYVLAHEGVGILVDPQRDVQRFLDAAGELDVELRWVFDTHLHNDYVSGAPEAARRSGAELVLPAAAVVGYPHTPAFHGEALRHGPLAVVPLHTPGHTPEHTSYLVLVDDEPWAVCSGGSLLVGSAGRSDLLGESRATALARAQHRSVHRLAELPDEVLLLPTHGEGSFCTSSGAGRTTSTIGQEKRDNPVLAYPDEAAFVEGELSGLVPYPDYYAHMGPVNLAGPEPMPERTVPTLTPAELDVLEDVTVVDGRPRDRFAAGHVPGALGIELDDSFGVWTGWLVAFDRPLVLVLDDDQDHDEALVQLARIGFDDVRGILPGMRAWESEGRPVASFRRVGVDDVVAALADGRSPQLLDVRAPDEWDAGHLPTAVYRYVPDLVAGPPAELDRARPVWVLCASGFRAMMAASLLERDDFEPIVLDRAGSDDVRDALQPAR